MRDKSVIEIEKELTTYTMEKLDEIIPALLCDERKSVRDLGKRMLRRVKSQREEYERINRMKEIEAGLRKKGFTVIAGIDEAGRGPLCGPVVAAAVILPEGFFVPGVNDSKKLSPQRREELFLEITEKCLDYAVGMVDSREIDRINILNATYKAVDIAIGRLNLTPQCLVLDAIKLPGCSMYQESVIKGDQKCLSVAAASIIAKVERDRYMAKVHGLYPEYNFESNKGYGTKEHIDAILKHGPCSEHRITFLRNIPF
ncbi:MAG: Ribonuclease HII [Firmicutes bacterium]|nr:Ribonuclease HII [Bacillota bacterium]MDI6704651.1 ribonuclease HII [Bacillota bacterium]